MSRTAEVRVNTGQIISGAGHLGLIGWALLGGVFSSEPLPFEVTEVTAISSEEFAALLTAERAPEAVAEIAIPEPPETGDTAPDLSSAADDTPDTAQPEVAETSAPDDAPEALDVTPPVEAEVTDVTPELSVPQEDVAVLVPELSTRPQPRPSTRVAPEPVAQPEPDVRIDDITQPETAPDETADIPREETEATTQEEAATEIVTEAEEAARAAPARSVRPKSRPARRDPEVETAETPATDSQSVNDALAEALGGGNSGQSAPSGPPLSRGEKDALRVAVQQCWNVGTLSTDALLVTVVIGVSLSEDGKPVIASIRKISASGGTGSAAKQAYEAGRRAIIRCGARGFDLPKDKYEHWQELEMSFNPEKMRIK